MEYKYGNSWERYSINSGEVWCDTSGSQVSVGDIRYWFPEYLLGADMVYSDPPWNMGNANCFLTKSGCSDYINSFGEFYDVFFRRIEEISPSVCYVEIGKQNVDIFYARMEEIFPVVQKWDIVYYKKNPCFLIRGSAAPTTVDFTGMDDSSAPLLAVSSECPKCVADIVTGQGLTAMAAWRQNVKFVGVEINKRRLAVAIDRVNSIGGCYARSVS